MQLKLLCLLCFSIEEILCFLMHHITRKFTAFSAAKPCHSFISKITRYFLLYSAISVIFSLYVAHNSHSMNPANWFLLFYAVYLFVNKKIFLFRYIYKFHLHSVNLFPAFEHFYSFVMEKSNWTKFLFLILFFFLALFSLLFYFLTIFCYYS